MIAIIPHEPISKSNRNIQLTAHLCCRRDLFDNAADNIFQFLLPWVYWNKKCCLVHNKPYQCSTFWVVVENCLGIPSKRKNMYSIDASFNLVIITLHWSICSYILTYWNILWSKSTLKVTVLIRNNGLIRYLRSIYRILCA